MRRIAYEENIKKVSDEISKELAGSKTEAKQQKAQEIRVDREQRHSTEESSRKADLTESQNIHYKNKANAKETS